MGEFLALAVRLNRLASGLADVGDVDPGILRRVAAEAEPAPADLVRLDARNEFELLSPAGRRRPRRAPRRAPRGR